MRDSVSQGRRVLFERHDIRKGLARRLFRLGIQNFNDFRRDAGQRAAGPIEHITVTGRPNSRLFEVGNAGLEGENFDNFGIVDVAEQAADILSARDVNG
jgi:hypothetical protein